MICNLDIWNNGPVRLHLGQLLDTQKIVIKTGIFNAFYKGMPFKRNTIKTVVFGIAKALKQCNNSHAKSQLQKKGIGLGN